MRFIRSREYWWLICMFIAYANSLACKRTWMCCYGPKQARVTLWNATFDVVQHPQCISETEDRSVSVHAVSQWLRLITSVQVLTISRCFEIFSSQNVMEQFNPGLRNLINLGKSYEKAVSGESFLACSLYRSIFTYTLVFNMFLIAS